MKRILALLLALLLCLSLLACDREEDDTPKSDKTSQTTGEEMTDKESPEEDQDKDKPEDDEDTDDPDGESVNAPLLYKVTDDKGNVAWLFGSIHLGRDDYYPLPDYVLDAFDGSDCLAVEFDIVAFEKDLKAQIAALQVMVYTDGTTISDHIPEDLYEEAVAIMEDAGIYNTMLDYYKPVLWSSFVDSTLYAALGADVNQGIDRHLLDRAKKADMPILDVESAEFQYGMLASFSEELQVLLLAQSVEQAKDPDTTKEAIASTMDLWASGDEEAFRKYLLEEGDVAENERALYEEYYKAMSKDRNEGMADFVAEALESGDEVFVCVGAAHIVGPESLLDLLPAFGYTVERVAK